MKHEQIAVTSLRSTGPAPVRLVGLDGLHGPLPDVAELQYGPASSPSKPVAHSVERLRVLREKLGLEFEIGTNVFAEYPAQRGTADAVFAPMKLGNDMHYVHAKGVDTLPASVSRVNFVLGVCLFSNRAVRLVGSGGAKHEVLMPMSEPISEAIERIDRDSALTLYELEAARRLPRLVAELAAALPAQVGVTITLDVPKVQYYCYLGEAYGKKLVSRRLLRQWYAMVDERYERVCRLFEAEFEAGLRRAGSTRALTMQRSQGLGGLEELMKSDGDAPLESLVAIMGRDEAWARALEVSEVATRRDLIDLSYVLELLRAGGWDGSDAVCVEVDDYVERKIYERAQKLVRTMQERDGGPAARMVGLYPLERIFTSQATGTTDLYLNDPGQVLEDVESSQSYSPAQLVDLLYD